MSFLDVKKIESCFLNVNDIVNIKTTYIKILNIKIINIHIYFQNWSSTILKSIQEKKKDKIKRQNKDTMILLFCYLRNNKSFITII